MILRKPTSRFILLAFTLLLLFGFFAIIINSSETNPAENDDDDFEGLEELLALDEEEENQQQDGDNLRTSEAKVLTKAQRIVLELSNDNSERVIEQNEYVLLLGYAPWCARSAELMPQFAEAANSLKELGSPILMAKLDADRYPKAASVLQIKGFPTLLLFVNGTSQAYTGGFTSEEIVIWVQKKTGVPVININSLNEAKEFLKKHHMFIVGRFEKFEGPAYEEFFKAASDDNEFQFVGVSDIEAATILFPDIKPSNNFLGLVKDEEERYTIYEGTFERERILHFLEHNKFPLVTKLTEMNSIRVYSSPVKRQVLIFAEDDELQNLLEPLQNVAKKFKSKVMFISIDIANENLAKPFLSLFSLEESDRTVVAAFDNGMSSKFLLESDPTPSNIEEFGRGLYDGTLSPYFRSQPIPNNEGASIQVAVGRTFDDLVLKNPNNVFLEVHTPWCITCETTSKNVEKLAKHFKDFDNIVFARIDASANEHPKLQVDDYPTLLFYPAADKSNPIKLSSKGSLKDLAKNISKLLKSEEQARSKDEL
ncbi:protein disulfide isomerase-like 1-6 [Benincasa hispida]|uniref:protein disulfide isomerase-like 1-6 n=1 Tax=Benincasa hispida TaxID=102211 RepID=UPI0019007219|nr:protein disulfide isomerase-like 1-6 [Benincasa hispida]